MRHPAEVAIVLTGCGLIYAVLPLPAVHLEPEIVLWLIIPQARSAGLSLATSATSSVPVPRLEANAGPRPSLLPALTAQQNGRVSAEEVDRYLAALEEPKRSTLERLRQTILDIIPEADQGISYGVPAFKVRGKTIAGFAAFKNHLSYLPHSGSVFGDLADDLKSYSTSSGALRFGIDEALPAPLVSKLIEVRMRQAFPT